MQPSTGQTPLRDAQIEQAQSSKDIWGKVETGALAIATDRAFSLLGLKGKELLSQVSAKIRPQVVKAVAELTKKEKPIEFSSSEKTLQVDRDTLAATTFAYGYKEGGLPFPDRVNGPGRTIITSEGGASVSASSTSSARPALPEKASTRLGPTALRAANSVGFTPKNLSV